MSQISASEAEREGLFFAPQPPRIVRWSRGLWHFTRTKRLGAFGAFLVITMALLALLADVVAEDIQLELDTADTLYEAGQYDEAIEAYEAALARVPFLTTINLQIGHAYREQKEYSKARAAYEEVLRSDPTDEEAKDALRMADLEENGQAAPRQP